MNCDQAFELLTDPVGSRSPLLQKHLDQCPRCREMQATLEPALEWLASAAPGPVESGDQPGAAPFLTAQAVQLAARAASTLPRVSRPPALARDAAWRAAQISLVALCGVFLGMTSMGWRPTVLPDDPHGAASATLTACLWEHPDGRRQLPDASARGVVVSCVVCHVPTTLD